MKGCRSQLYKIKENLAGKFKYKLSPLRMSRYQEVIYLSMQLQFYEKLWEMFPVVCEGLLS
jgi:hypothetical protein